MRKKLVKDAFSSTLPGWNLSRMASRIASDGTTWPAADSMTPRLISSVVCDKKSHRTSRFKLITSGRCCRHQITVTDSFIHSCLKPFQCTVKLKPHIACETRSHTTRDRDHFRGILRKLQSLSHAWPLGSWIFGNSFRSFHWPPWTRRSLDSNCKA